MPNVTAPRLRALDASGLLLEASREDAERMGAMEDDAMSEADALDAAIAYDEDAEEVR
ncbi:hypothetical protein J2T57_001682 [Natronocella acetinitrilica]|uniref:Uncharacterized protein n=1 Tax=Natronocella acetinitrilica TaxID=414046 RepID=A0AAE3G2J8_9GAMM|nr:hypothetical protein [Natronocella acetinitrilica]MCP1674580.1 hypothetical protein [Natronocella acetinitrilica]